MTFKEKFKKFKTRFTFKLRCIWQLILNDRFHLIIFKKRNAHQGFIDTFDFNMLSEGQRSSICDVLEYFMESNLRVEDRMNKIVKEAEKILS